MVQLLVHLALKWKTVACFAQHWTSKILLSSLENLQMSLNSILDYQFPIWTELDSQINLQTWDSKIFMVLNSQTNVKLWPRTNAMPIMPAHGAQVSPSKTSVTLLQMPKLSQQAFSSVTTLELLSWIWIETIFSLWLKSIEWKLFLHFHKWKNLEYSYD